MPYVLFYRRDGGGVPFAFVPLSPEPATICNFYDNWRCLYDFLTSEMNQAYIPAAPPVTGCNDQGYLARAHADGSLPAVRVVFFPELGWNRGGKGQELRDRIDRSLKENYLKKE